MIWLIKERFIYKNNYLLLNIHISNLKIISRVSIFNIYILPTKNNMFFSFINFEI